ncbi:hypothetical protein D3C84_802660 [compost metagenome]
MIRQAHGQGLTLHTEAIVKVQQRGVTIRIENQTVERTHALEFVCRIQLTARFGQAGIDHILYRLQLGASTEGTNALDLVSLDGEALRQVDGVERDQVALAGRDHQTRATSLTGRHECQGVTVLFDLYGQGGDAFLTEQAQGTDATRQVGLIVECSSQRGNGKRFVVKNGDLGHGYSPEMKNPAQSGVHEVG